MSQLGAGGCPKQLHWAAAAATCLAVLTVMAAGCGKPVPPGMVRVTGSVMLDGKPLRSETGGLNFAAATGTSTGGARIHPDGTFTVNLMPGDYQVTVRVTDGYDRLGEAGKPSHKAKSLIPARYDDPATSGLTVTAKAGGAPVTLSLESQ